MLLALYGSLDRLVMIRREWQSFLALVSPPPPLSSTQFKGALSGIEKSVEATPIPLKGKDASSKQSGKSMRPRRNLTLPSRHRGGRPSQGPHSWRVAQGATLHG